jgi:hypothetical protein
LISKHIHEDYTVVGYDGLAMYFEQREAHGVLLGKSLQKWELGRQRRNTVQVLRPLVVKSAGTELPTNSNTRGSYHQPSAPGQTAHCEWEVDCVQLQALILAVLNLQVHLPESQFRTNNGANLILCIVLPFYIIQKSSGLLMYIIIDSGVI